MEESSPTTRLKKNISFVPLGNTNKNQMLGKANYNSTLCLTRKVIQNKNTRLSFPTQNTKNKKIIFFCFLLNTHQNLRPSTGDTYLANLEVTILLGECVGVQNACKIWWIFLLNRLRLIIFPILTNNIFGQYCSCQTTTEATV